MLSTAAVTLVATVALPARGARVLALFEYYMAHLEVAEKFHRVIA